MTSTVEVKRKEAGGREVISLFKEYRGEEHEVMFPLDQDLQVLVNLMSAINEDKEREKQFVLMRRETVGAFDSRVVDTHEGIKQSVLESVVSELYGEEIATEVSDMVKDERE